MKRICPVRLLALANRSFAPGAPLTLLNVSHDPPRELYPDYNVWFTSYWKTKTGQTLTVQPSQGGSSKQAGAVLDGLEARR